MDNYLTQLTTEQVNRQTLHIDECDTAGMLRLINNQDSLVPAAVAEEIPHIAAAVDVIVAAFRSGGRLFYVGAGTSGRLGILDASECPPTYGTDPDMVQAYIAGGDTAMRTAVEGSEDSEEGGVELVRRVGVRAGDVVVGITASGGAPFVLAAVRESHRLGAHTVGLVTNPHSQLEKLVDISIAPQVGPEVIIGSTRMKSGTAQKLVLNMLTTCAMIQMGKVYGNLMVDLRPTNRKLRDRARRIIGYATGVDRDTAGKYLGKSGGNTKLAILMIRTGLDSSAAREVLESAGGKLKRAIQQAGERRAQSAGK